MSVVGTAVLRLLGDSTQFQADLKKASERATKFGKEIESAGNQLSTRLTLPLVAAGTAAIKFATDFNSGMANVATLIPGSTARVQELGQAVKEMGVETGKTLGDLTGGLYQTISAFGDTADSVDILRINALAAAGGLAETTDAINLTSAVTKAYGDTSAVAVEKAADLALMTVRLGQTTFPELAASIGRVTPLAAALNVTQEELFGTMATFTGVTGSAAEVSTQLRGVLQALMAPTADMSKLLKDLGIESGAALIQQKGLQGAIETVIGAAKRTGQPLQKFVTSIEGQTLALAATSGQADAYTEKTSAMADAAGTTQVAFDEQTTGINASGFAMKQARTQIQAAATDLGDVLLPAVASVAQEIAGLTGKFGELTPATQKTVVVVAALVAGLGPALTIIGNVSMALGGLGTAIAFATGKVLAFTATAAAVLGPVSLVIISVGTLAALASVVAQNWGVLSYEFTRVWNGIVEAVKAGIGAVVDLVTGFASGVVGRFKWIYDTLVGHSVIPDLMKRLGEEFGGLDKLMVAPADEAARKVREAFESIGTPEKLAKVGFDVSIDAGQLYAAVIAATGRASVAFDALSGIVPPTASAFVALMEEVEETSRATIDYEAAARGARRGILDLHHQILTTDHAMAEYGLQVDRTRATTVELSAASQQAFREQYAAMKANEMALKAHKIATDTMAMASDQTRYKFQNLQRESAGVISQFTPLGIVAMALGHVMDAMRPVIQALEKPFEVLGKIVAAAIVPILKALWPAFKMLAVVATYVVEGFLYVAGAVLQVSGWLQKAIGSFVEGLGKILSKIPLIGGIFKPLKKAGKALRETGEAQMQAGKDMWKATADVREGRKELQAMEWPEEAVEASASQVEATEANTDATEATTGAVVEVGDSLADPIADIRDAVLSMRDLAVEGVGYLAGIAGAFGVASSGMVAAAAPAGAESITTSTGVAVDTVVIQVDGGMSEREARAAGEAAGSGFLSQVSGQQFSRTRRLVTRSGRIERTD